MNESTSWTPAPCLGLDVHKATTTATYLGPDGKTKRVWTFPTTRSALHALAAEIEPHTPMVLEASTSGKAVATLLKEAGRELHMASPRDVALIAKSPVKTDAREPPSSPTSTRRASFPSAISLRPRSIGCVSWCASARTWGVR